MTPTNRSSFGGGHAAFAVAITLTLVAAAGCDDPTQPTGPTNTLEEGHITVLESTSNWGTNSVTWINAAGNGIVPENRFAFIAVSGQATPNGPSHFFFSAPVTTSCNEDCFPATGGGWSGQDGDLVLAIEHLDWSSTGSQVVFQGRDKNRRGSPWRIYVMDPVTESPSVLVNGTMPSFNRTGTRVTYVTGGDIVCANPQGGSCGSWDVELNPENPVFSPGDSLLAFSAATTNGRRIFVRDVRDPALTSVVVSDPDTNTRDGANDNNPTWSPNSRFLAYTATRQDGSDIRDGIYITKMGERAGPEAIRRVARFGQAVRLQYLDWHPDGRLLLYVLQGDAYVIVLPSEFWDQEP